MRVVFAMLALAVLITGCDAGPAAGQYQYPYGAPSGPDLITTARALEQRGTQAAIATADVQRATAEQGTLQAAETKGASEAEIAAINARMGERQKEVELRQTLTADEMYRAYATQDAQATRTTGTQQAGATQTAYPAAVWATRDSGQRTATIAAATDAEFGRIVREDAQQEQDDRNAAFVWLFIKGMGAGAAVVALFGLSMILLKYLDRKLEIKASIRYTPLGIVHVKKEGGRLQVDLIQAMTPQSAQSAAPPVGRAYPDLNELDALDGLDRLHSQAEPRGPRTPEGVQALAIRWLRDARKVAGGDAEQFPRWEDVDGWTRGMWDRAIKPMEKRKPPLINVVPSVGSFVLEPYNTIDGLLYELETGHIELKPVE